MLISQHSSFRLASRSIPFRSTYTAYRPLLPYQCTFPLRSSLWMQDSQWCPTFCGNKHFHWHPHHRRFTYCCSHDSKLYSFIFSPFWRHHLLSLVWSLAYNPHHRRSSLPHHPLGKEPSTHIHWSEVSSSNKLIHLGIMTSALYLWEDIIPLFHH